MTVLLNNSIERIRFFRFALVGITGAVVDFGVSNLLIKLFNTRLLIAGSISFIAAIINNFILNRYWTYPDSRSKPVSQQLAQFAVISIMGLGIRIPILYFVEPWMEFLAERYNLERLLLLDAKTTSDNLTLAIAVVVVMFWNFFANRYWTYSDVE
jgi:putative flippase GtrA